MDVTIEELKQKIERLLLKKKITNDAPRQGPVSFEYGVRTGLAIAEAIIDGNFDDFKEILTDDD